MGGANWWIKIAVITFLEYRLNRKINYQHFDRDGFQISNLKRIPSAKFDDTSLSFSNMPEIWIVLSKHWTLIGNAKTHDGWKTFLKMVRYTYDGGPKWTVFLC